MNYPECNKNQNEAERNLRSNLPFLSDNVDSKALEISHDGDTKMCLLQRKLPSINNQIFKQRLSSTGLKWKESGENFNNMNSISKKSFIGKQSSQTGRKSFGSVYNDQPAPNNFSHLTQTPSNTNSELITSSLSKYKKLKKAVEAFRKVTQELYGTIDLEKENVRC